MCPKSPSLRRDAKTLGVSVMRSGSAEALWPQQVAWILLAVNNRVTLRLSMDKRLNLKGETSLSTVREVAGAAELARGLVRAKLLRSSQICQPSGSSHWSEAQPRQSLDS